MALAPIRYICPVCLERFLGALDADRPSGLMASFCAHNFVSLAAIVHDGLVYHWQLSPSPSADAAKAQLQAAFGDALKQWVTLHGGDRPVM